jgi:hypothetical protein
MKQQKEIVQSSKKAADQVVGIWAELFNTNA